MATEITLQRIADRLDIIALTGRYAKAVDTRNIDLLMELWSDDEPVFDEEGFGLKRITGKQEIREFVESEVFGQLAAMCHLTSNHLVAEITDTTANGTCTVLFEGDLRDNGGQMRATGYYEDRYVRENGAWKFASRKVVPLTKPRVSAAAG